MRIGAYVALLAATVFGLMSLVSGLMSMALSRALGKTEPGIALYVAPVCANVLMWLGVSFLWALLIEGPMPVLLFALLFLVYLLTARDPRLTPYGSMLAAAEQWSVLVAGVAHVSLAGIRWL